MGWWLFTHFCFLNGLIFGPCMADGCSNENGFMLIGGKMREHNGVIYKKLQKN